MSVIDLKYGLSSVPVEHDAARASVLAPAVEPSRLSDLEIGTKFDGPTGTRPLEEIVSAGESVLFCVPDATRQAAGGQMVNLLIRRLISAGTLPHQISIIFSTGIHRKTTAAEKVSILTPFIAQRIRMLDHDPRDLMQIVRLGETDRGIPVELNRALVENDHVVLIGGVSFHYFAGFTGGRKLVCPGLASAKTVSETHKLAFDCDAMTRRPGVDTGRLEGNAVHEAFMQAAQQVAPAFAVTSTVDGAGFATGMECGHWIDSHRRACDVYADDHTIPIAELRDLVIVSCGGWPYDINLIQAHKAIDAAARACKPGGTIVALAECPDGLGHPDMLNWFDAANSDDLADSLCRKYQVNGQTAWSLLRKAEEFDIRLVTDLDVDTCRRLRLTKINDTDILPMIAASPSAYILPQGAKVLVALDPQV